MIALTRTSETAVDVRSFGDTASHRVESVSVHVQSAAVRFPRACRLRVSRAHARALREPQLSRLGGLLRRQRVRDASRARIQRHPQRLRASSTCRRSSSTASSGRDATRLVDRVITRDAKKMAVGQVYYTPWCDEEGKVIDDGTVTRLAEQVYRWTAADPNLRWFTENAAGLDVSVEDISEQVAALALQGPTSARLLRQVSTAPIDTLKYFRVDVGIDRRRAGRHHANRLHRRSRLRGLDAVGRRDSRLGRHRRGGPRVRSASDGHARARRRAHRGRPAAHRRRFSQQPQGDDRVAEVLAVRARPRAPGRSRQGPVRRTRRRWRPSTVAGRGARSSASKSIGPRSNGLYEAVGLPPTAPATASRVAVPVYKDGRQVGRATSTTWSTTLKKLIALATIDAPHHAIGTQLELEVTVEAVRHTASATVVKTPFFNPAAQDGARRWS